MIEVMKYKKQRENIPEFILLKKAGESSRTCIDKAFISDAYFSLYF